MKCLNEQAMLKLAKTALGITINPKGSAFFYQNCITTSWIVASKCKKRVWMILFYACLYVCACFFSPLSSQMLDELPWQVSHLRFLLEGKIVQRSASLFIFTVYLPGSRVSGTSQFVYKCNEVSFFFFLSLFFSQISSVSQPTHNNIFHPLLLGNSASAHLDTWTLSRPRLWSEPNGSDAPFLYHSMQSRASFVSTLVHVGPLSVTDLHPTHNAGKTCKPVLDLFWLTLDK